VAVVRNAGRATAGVAEDVIEEHAGADVAALDEALGERVEEAHGLDQVRGEALQQESTLNEGFAHEAEVELLEVADAAVHELRGAAGCAARPVAGLDHTDTQATGDRVERRAGSDDAAADHEDVEFLRLQRLDGCGAFLRPQLRGTGDGIGLIHSGLLRLVLRQRCRTHSAEHTSLTHCLRRK
jgi:hypothetical protein